MASSVSAVASIALPGTEEHEREERESKLHNRIKKGLDAQKPFLLLHLRIDTAAFAAYCLTIHFCTWVRP